MKVGKILGLGLACVLTTFTCQAQFTSTVVSLTGSVLDRSSHKPVSLQIDVLDANGEKYTKAKSNSKDGYYFITGLKPGQTYTVNITDLKYLKNSMLFEVPNTDKYSEYSKDIQMVGKAVNSKIKFMVPTFEAGESTLRAGSELFLDEYVKILVKNPEIKVSLDVYPDNNLDKSKNKALTTGRGEAIKAYFGKMGVDAGRVTVAAYDATDKLNPPPSGKTAKGKKYIGSVYMKITALK